jgi:outer membrane protein OmpA-like peptidoglycan-associated protein
MRRALTIIAVTVALSSAMLAAHAQRRPATEAEALIYIQSAFTTQADPGLLKPDVTVGPELRKALSLPAGASGEKVYEAVVRQVGDKPFDVRRPTRDEIDLYGVRRGFDPGVRQPLFVLAVENKRFLLRYDLRALQVTFVGQLGLLDPEPIAVPAPPPITILTPVSHAWTTQFEYGSSKLTLHSQVLLETDVLPKLKKAKEVRYLNVSGHADRLGSAQYNQELSEKRAQALKAWLVAHGVDPDQIETFGYGQTLPVKSCPDEKRREALVECLAPNRRVVIELKGAVPAVTP